MSAGVATGGVAMDLKSGYPFWAIKNGLLGAFAPLRADRACDVAIIGGGITGALIADELAAHGHEVIVLERRDIGWGSTSASTAMLQYEIDTHMTELAARYDPATAALAYYACLAAFAQLEAVMRGLGDVGYARTDSLYAASRPAHVGTLQAEVELRAEHGFPVQWLTAGETRERYGVVASGAILSEAGAVVDPYKLAWRLLARVQRRGGAVHDRTVVARLQPTARGVRVHTDDGAIVRARHVVIASGYQAQRWLDRKVATNRSSYACVSDPLLPAELGALARTLLWESARPYLYARPTTDGRLMVGGLDDKIDMPARRDARVELRARQLCGKLRTRVPRLAFTPAFAWAGTFAETDDGLPFFGATPQHGPRVLFAMAYGGNGITYSTFGAGLVRALIERTPHPLAQLCGFERVDRQRR